MGEEKNELSRSAQSMPSPRLGVSWTSDHALRGVGSELSPAIAALVMTPHSNGDDAGIEEASPRLSGQPSRYLPLAKTCTERILAEKRKPCCAAV